MRHRVGEEDAAKKLCEVVQPHHDRAFRFGIAILSPAVPDSAQVPSEKDRHALQTHLLQRFAPYPRLAGRASHRAAGSSGKRRGDAAAQYRFSRANDAAAGYGSSCDLPSDTNAPPADLAVGARSHVRTNFAALRRSEDSAHAILRWYAQRCQRSEAATLPSQKSVLHPQTHVVRCSTGVPLRAIIDCRSGGPRTVSMSAACSADGG
jgi:hypothetical protein